MVGTINLSGLHVVRECDGFASAVVVDPGLCSVFFGSAYESEGLSRTTKEVERLFEGRFKNMTRRSKGDKIVAIAVFLTDGAVVELHPEALAAENAYGEYLGISG